MVTNQSRLFLATGMIETQSFSDRGGHEFVPPVRVRNARRKRCLRMFLSPVRLGSSAERANFYLNPTTIERPCENCFTIKCVWQT